MTVQSDIALLAAGSYWDARDANAGNVNSSNRAPIPEGWQVIEFFGAGAVV